MDTGSFDKLLNRIIDKKYKIESAVGVGGMAYVLKAQDISDGKTVAIKFLSDEFKNDERAVKRFINESKTIAMLDHENIVKVYDVVINDERKYIVMEFIDGITLKDYIDKIGTLSWKEAIHYIKQILSALDHAHEKQVIHRDIKPQNIMLLPDGKVKVTDFGIAKQPGAESITMTDKAIGTVNYISPEQASGAAVDTRTDIYSVGVMLYEMVTGRLPFIADSPVAVAMMQVTNEPMSPREVNSQIPVGLEQIILKAMQKHAEERFASASAMLKALTYFAKNPAIVFMGSVTNTGATGAKLTEEDYIDSEKKAEKLKKKIRGSRSMFPIVSGIAAAAIIVLIFATSSLWLPIFASLSGGDSENNIDNVLSAGSETLTEVLGGGNDSETVRVASFVDRVYDDELVNDMREQGYAVEMVKPVKENGKASNVVVKQYPETGAVRIKPENGKLIPVTLYVNMSEDEIYMPDCVLMSEETAKTLIAKEVSALMGGNFSSADIKVKYYAHSSYPKGYVIKTEPAANTFINKNELPEIIISVSMGKKIETTTIPVLAGLTKEEAEASVRSKGLAVGKLIYELNPVAEAGTVIRACIPGGTGEKTVNGGEIVAKGITAVDLYVSIGDGTEKTEDPEKDNPEEVTPDEAGGTENTITDTPVPDNTVTTPEDTTENAPTESDTGADTKAPDEVPSDDISDVTPLPPVPQQPSEGNSDGGESDISNLLDMRG